MTRSRICGGWKFQRPLHRWAGLTARPTGGPSPDFFFFLWYSGEAREGLAYRSSGIALIAAL